VSNIDVETRAIALVSQTIVWKILARLPQADAVAILEEGLAGFENSLPDAHDIRMARQILEQFIQIASMPR
jgi:hypothetical protein